MSRGVSRATVKGAIVDVSPSRRTTASWLRLGLPLLLAGLTGCGGCGSQPDVIPLTAAEKELTSLVMAYNDATSSYERRLRPSGERLLELGAANGHKQLPEMTRIEEPLSLPVRETPNLLNL